MYETGIWRPEMEITKEAPWSRIGDKTAWTEFLEVVGNGMPAGSALKETLVVSVTMSTSVQKWHCRIRLRILSCSRMREMRREPEVPEEEVPVVESLDGPARIASQELAPIHSVKSGTLQNAYPTRLRVVVGLSKSARMHIVRLMNNLVKRYKKNDDKSAVAMLKKYDLHDRTWQTTCCEPWRKSRRTEQNVVKRDTCHELKHGLVGCRSSNTRQLGCVFQDMKPPKSILRKSSDMQKPIQRVKFTKAVARHTKIRDHNPFACIRPGEPHQLSPNAPKFEDRSQEETEWQEQGAREAAWKLAKRCVKNLRSMKEQHSSHLQKNRCHLASNLETWGTRICCRLRGVDAHDQHKGLEWCWIRYFDEIV